MYGNNVNLERHHHFVFYLLFVSLLSLFYFILLRQGGFVCDMNWNKRQRWLSYIHVVMCLVLYQCPLCISVRVRVHVVGEDIICYHCSSSSSPHPVFSLSLFHIYVFLISNTKCSVVVFVVGWSSSSRRCMLFPTKSLSS